MCILGTFATFVLVLAATAALAFFAVLLLAGPHGGVLPSSLHAATLALAWVVVLVVPVLASRRGARPRAVRDPCAMAALRVGVARRGFPRRCRAGPRAP